MKLNNSAILASLAFTALCGALFIWADIDERRIEEKTNLFYHNYTIEPESLLGELEAENVNVFSAVDEAPPLIPPNQQIPVPWMQDDYLHIANALFQFVWGDADTVKGWQLNSMNFALGCEEVNIGFQDGNFRFFKIKKTNEGESRIERIVNIDPRSKVVAVTENKSYPVWADWSAIDLEQNLLSAEEILQIAENAGGLEKRLSVENACDISLLLSPDSASYNGWTVSYSRRDDGTTFFYVEVDPITGEIH
jgi:hypothetical protein